MIPRRSRSRTDMLLGGGYGDVIEPLVVLGFGVLVVLGNFVICEAPLAPMLQLCLPVSYPHRQADLHKNKHI